MFLGDDENIGKVNFDGKEKGFIMQGNMKIRSPITKKA
jgi:hypothetical protein